MTVEVVNGVTTRRWRPTWYEHWSPDPASGPQVILVPPYVPPIRLLNCGAAANDTGDPIGGGAGYSDIKTSGDYAPTDKAGLLTALAAASPGEIIFIGGAVEIDFSGVYSSSIPAGVTLASNRGFGGSLGGLIYTNDADLTTLRTMFIVNGSSRVTGLRLRGNDSSVGVNGTSGYQAIHGTSVSYEVDNCEIYNFPYMSVRMNEGAADVHHNSIHHCQRSGYGYGVAVYNGTATVYANSFDYNRHDIVGARGTPLSNFYAYYNICGPHHISACMDMHGGNDVSDMTIPAGGTIVIRQNTFQDLSNKSVNIRGIPDYLCDVYRNWTYYAQSQSSWAFCQKLDNLGLSPYIKMLVHDNWYGTSTPPS